MPEQPISRVLFLNNQAMVIQLGRLLPDDSCDLPESIKAGSPALLFGLAPDGVYQAIPVTRDTGELLPHLFTLTLKSLSNFKAVYFLWHFP